MPSDPTLPLPQRIAREDDDEDNPCGDRGPSGYLCYLPAGHDGGHRCQYAWIGWPQVAASEDKEGEMGERVSDVTREKVDVLLDDYADSLEDYGPLNTRDVRLSILAAFHSVIEARDGWREHARRNIAETAALRARLALTEAVVEAAQDYRDATERISSVLARLEADVEGVPDPELFDAQEAYEAADRQLMDALAALAAYDAAKETK